MKTPWLRRLGFSLPVMVLVTSMLCGISSAMEWVDGLVARVNGQPILISEISASELLFHSGKTFFELDDRQRFEAISRTIERHLLLAEAKRFDLDPPSDQAVEEARWVIHQRLDKPIWWLDDQTLRKTIRDQLWMESFINVRIGAFIMIRDDVVARELVAQGGPKPGESEADAKKRVRQVLETNAAEERLHRYLTRLLKRADIKRYAIPRFAK